MMKACKVYGYLYIFPELPKERAQGAFDYIHRRSKPAPTEVQDGKLDGNRGSVESHVI